MSNIVEIWNKAVEESGAQITADEVGKFNEAAKRVSLMERVPSRAQQFSQDIVLTMGSIFENHSELHPFVNEILDGFIDAAQENSKNTLKEALEEVKIQYSSGYSSKKQSASIGDLSPVVQELVDLSKDQNFKSQIGEAYAKEFRDHIDKLAKEYNESVDETKPDLLIKNLKIIEEWAEEKKQGEQGVQMGKVQDMVTLLIKTVKSFINNEKTSLSEFIQEGVKIIDELKSSGQAEEKFSSLKEEARSWQDVVKKSQVAQKGREEQAR